MNKQGLDNSQKRYLMPELSCADRKRNPCTYPNRGRSERESGQQRHKQTSLSAIGALLFQKEVQSLHLSRLSEIREGGREKEPVGLKVSGLSGDEGLRSVL